MVSGFRNVSERKVCRFISEEKHILSYLLSNYYIPVLDIEPKQAYPGNEV